MNYEAMVAARLGNITRIKEILDEGTMKINDNDASGKTLLHHAASRNEHEMVRFLLNNGADILKTNGKNNTALHISTAYNDVATTRAILENVPRDKLKKLLDLKTKSNGNAAIHIAAKNGCYSHVSFMLKYGANYEIENSAGKAGIDVTSDEYIRKLFKLLDSCFAKAKKHDRRLVDDLRKVTAQDFTSAINCRNRDGHSITQMIVLNARGKSMDLPRDMLHFRTWQGNSDQYENKYEDKRRCDIEKLAEQLKSTLDFWSEHSDSMIAYLEKNKPVFRQLLMKTATSSSSSSEKVVQRQIEMGKLCSRALEKAHEILLAYWKFDVEFCKSLIANPWMKMLEEIIEALGFDTQQLFVIVGNEACSYYEKLPVAWKEDILALTLLTDEVIYGCINMFMLYHNSQRLILAVSSDDLDEVERLLKDKVHPNSSDHRRQTALCYAAQADNPNIIRALLKAGARVAIEGMVSPVYFAASQGNVKVVKLLLKHVNAEKMKIFIDCRQSFGSTALHAAARKGCLEIVKILLRYGATYSIVDENGRTPIKVTSNDDVSEFLRLVDEYFRDANAADTGLIDKFKAMEINDFMAVAGARNRDGKTLIDVANKANAKNLAATISRRIKQLRSNKSN